jgi:predicted RNA-binding protein Jag
MTMDWIVTTGSTVDEALDLALDTLSVTHDDIEFEIVKEPRKSVLGLRKSSAQVRARVRPIEPPAKREWRRPPKSEKQKRSARSKSKKTVAKRPSTGSKSHVDKKQIDTQRKTSSPSKEDISNKGEETPKTRNTRKRTINGSSPQSNIRSIDSGDQPPSDEAPKSRRTRKINP